MAYLPGERPLVNPWLRTSDSADLEQSTQTDELSVVCLRGVSGPGSSFVEWGEEGRKTKLIAVVKGPRQQSITRPQLEVEVSFASFAGILGNEQETARIVASFVKEAIEGSLNLDARASTSTGIYIKVLEGDGSLHSLAAGAIIAANAACREARISMFDDVLATCVRIDSSGSMSGYSGHDRSSSRASLCVAVQLASKRVSFIDMTGQFTNADSVEEAITLAEHLVEDMRARVDLR